MFLISFEYLFGFILFLYYSFITRGSQETKLTNFLQTHTQAPQTISRPGKSTVAHN